MKLIYILFAAIVCTFFNVNAQQPKQSKADREKWLKEVREYKHDMLIEATEMSAAQKSEFLPLYSAMEKEIYQVNIDARNLENKISNSSAEISDLEYQKAAEALAEVKAREGEIELEYFKKFEKILSKKQLFLLKRAENRFTRDMLNHNRKGKSSKTK
ncbi:MAG: hypothetical protein ACI4UN_04215 [Muribaculaceae bacterium]